MSSSCCNAFTISFHQVAPPNFQSPNSRSTNSTSCIFIRRALSPRSHFSSRLPASRTQRNLHRVFKANFAKDESAAKDVDDNTESGGPPFLTILAGIFVFAIVLWVFGSLIMWLFGLFFKVNAK